VSTFGRPKAVRIPNVKVVRETGTLLWCRADGREFSVLRDQLFGDALRKVGDRGALVVPEWFAHDHGFRT